MSHSRKVVDPILHVKRTLLSLALCIICTSAFAESAGVASARALFDAGKMPDARLAFEFEDGALAALQEIETSMPYIAGKKVISSDEQGDPIYEDVGLTPRFVELTRKNRKKLEAELTRHP